MRMSHLVDILTSMPLEALVKEVRAEGSFLHAHFEVLEHVSCAKIPRLVLRHASTSTEVDVISDLADPSAPVRDEVTRSLLGWDPRVRELACLIGDWARLYQAEMPPKIGFPNSYTFRLTGFHYLMIRPRGPLLPALAATGTSLCSAALSPGQMTAVRQLSAKELFLEWLGHLAAAGDPDRGLWANLRKPWESGPGPQKVRWGVIDPVSGRNLTNFRGMQPGVIANVAREAANEVRATKAMAGK
ncbi:unnamed protein product [Polarella glacialis]|uniref:Uncharacterized protein n=1 Tax=Polarella glacialis TaxID=89957 RepID=A0A813LK16_POLGL|nr:unnamed protein product [Polarella glacialis]